MKKFLIVMFLALVPRCSVSVQAQVWYYVWLQHEIRDRQQRETQELKEAEKAEKVRQWQEKQRAVKKYGNSVSVSKIPSLVTILKSENSHLKPKQKAVEKMENTPKEPSYFSSRMQNPQQMSQDGMNAPTEILQKEKSLVKRSSVVGLGKNDNPVRVVNVGTNSANDEGGNTFGLWVMVGLVCWIAFWCLAIFSSSDDSETRSLSY